MRDNFLHKEFKLDGKSFENEKYLLDFTKTSYSEIHKFLVDWFNESNFITVKTSGSTGKPKSIELKKEFMINSATATGKFFNLQAKTTTLLCLSVNFIAGKMMLVRAMLLGWHLDVIEPSSNPLDSIDKFYDFSAMVPMQLFNSLNKINHTKILIVGGGVVSKKLQNRIKNLETKFFATYGMTETITHIAVKPLNKEASLNFENEVYQTLPDVIISKDNRDCLVIDAPKISDIQLITNDLVEIHSNNQFKWLGRYDNIINSGGIKLIPEQIEKKLSAVIDCRFFVTGLPDEILGEKLVLIIEGESFELDKKALNNILSKYEIPKEIYFVDNFVVTGTKKINRIKTTKIIFK